jgi:hypothetical protein
MLDFYCWQTMMWEKLPETVQHWDDLEWGRMYRVYQSTFEGEC